MTAAESGAESEIVVGVDVGGTFTDLIYVDRTAGQVRLAKTPTTPDNQARGVLAALEAAAVALERVKLIVHGTTTTTNAVLERQLCRTGLITTAGFRDLLELGRRTRPQAYGLFGEFRPVIPRDLRLEVAGRMDAEGRVLQPLDEAAVAAAVERLIAEGCESLVILFLHAYANPAHEKRAAEIARGLWPNRHITMSHALLSESREYERGVTAAVNASVQPLLERYLERLVGELRARGYRRELLVMNGNGGMVSAERVAAEAAKTVMSGPASGVMAAAYTGRRAAIGNLITYDMGGTSSDVALIRDAEPAVSSEIDVEYAMPIHLPMVDVRTVGAGGGSIARVDEAGLLQVGPQSAGADPGPICYAKGGQEPTISDANLLLGRLNAKALLAVDSPVSRQAVAEIFERRLGQPLGLEVDAAAAAVLKVANARMAGAIRMVSISLGADPRDFALFAFGGAGPLHAAALAKELGVPRVLVPARPGITNALGCVVADLRHDFVNTVNRPLESADMAEVQAIFARQEAEGRRLIESESVGVREIQARFSADMQFIGQTHLLRVPLPDGRPQRADLQRLFEETYFQRFQVALEEIEANLVNLNCSVVGLRPELALSVLIDAAERRDSLEAALIERRPVWFEEGWLETPVYRRDWLPAGASLTGPALVEQMDATTVIEPGNLARQDAEGNILIEIAGGLAA